MLPTAFPEESMFNHGGLHRSRSNVGSRKLARRGFLIAASLGAFLVGMPARGEDQADSFRFLTQASFGPTASELERVQTFGIPAYLEEQFTQPQSGYPDSQITSPR